MSCPFLFMGRFNIATGNIPEPEPVIREKSISEKQQELSRAIEQILTLVKPEERSRMIDNLLQDPYYRTDSNGPDSEFATMSNVPSSSSLRISGPSGNQIIIPIRNVVASIRNSESSINDLEFVIRMPRNQANLLITDIHNAQSSRGISTRGR